MSFGLGQDKKGDPSPKFKRGEMVEVEDMPDYTQVWSVGDYDDYVKTRRYVVMNPINHRKLNFFEKNMSKAKNKRAMNKELIAKELLKIAKSIIGTTIRKGDVCTVDIRQAARLLGGGVPAGHQLKILRDVIRQGDGKVLVEETNGSMAVVTAYDNPVSRIVGGVGVPVSALTKVI